MEEIPKKKVIRPNFFHCLDDLKKKVFICPIFPNVEKKRIVKYSAPLLIKKMGILLKGTRVSPD